MLDGDNQIGCDSSEEEEQLSRRRHDVEEEGDWVSHQQYSGRHSKHRNSEWDQRMLDGDNQIRQSSETDEQEDSGQLHAVQEEDEAVVSIGCPASVTEEALPASVAEEQDAMLDTDGGQKSEGSSPDMMLEEEEGGDDVDDDVQFVSETGPGVHTI